MSKILSLSKILFLEQFKSFFAKVSLGKKAKSILLTILLSLLLMFVIGTSYYSQHLVLKAEAMGQYTLFYALINVVMILVIMFTLQIQSAFFEAKDFELLASMPLKKHEIIISKLLSQLANAYMISFFVFAPSLYFFYSSVAFNFLSVIYLVIGFLFVPMFNFFLATLLSFCVNLISNKFNNPKKVRNIFSYVFMIAMFLGVFVLNSSVVNQIAQIKKLPEILKWVLPTIAFYFDSVINTSLISFLLATLINIAFMALVVLMLYSTYFKINKNKTNVKRKVKTDLSYEKKSVLKNLVKFEFKRFFGMPLYVINSSLGAILSTVAVVALPIVYFTTVRGTSIEQLLFDKNFVFMIGMLGAMVLSVSNCTTYASVSVEGQMYYFKKSLPISFEKSMLAKLILNMLLIIPTIILAFICLPVFIMAKLYFYEIFLIFGIIIASQTFIALFGLFANLMFIKLDWTNPNALIKQSFPVFLYSIVLMVVLVGSMLGIPFLLTIMQAWLVAFLIFVFFLLLSVLLWFLIKTVGKKNYKKIG